MQVVLCTQLKSLLTWKCKAYTNTDKLYFVQGDMFDKEDSFLLAAISASQG